MTEAASAFERWNELPHDDAEAELLSCCGSRRWAAALSARRPYHSPAQLLEDAAGLWQSLGEDDWFEAFRCHPRIGESAAPAANNTTQSAAWSSQEQGAAQQPDTAIKQAIAENNREYERRFGFIYIVCATGKTAVEMLAILQHRLNRDRSTELHEAAAQQQQITEIRIKKWLGL